MADAKVIEILGECCEYGIPAIILSPESGIYCHARFAALSADALTLGLAAGSEPPPKETKCCVSFSPGKNSRAFFAKVLDFHSHPHPQSSELVLELPDRVMGTEARMAFRVPIGRKLAPRVRLSTPEGRSWAVTAIDLSIVGILVEFPADKDPGLSVRDEFELELRLGADAVRLKAEVRRRDGHRYGLMFPESITRQGLIPPPPLKEIVETLERNWLQERIR